MESNLLQEIEVSYRRTRPDVPVVVKTSQSAEAVIRKAYELEDAQIDMKEHFFILLLDRANQVLGYHLLAIGGVCSTTVDIKLCFGIALKCVASSIILAHNHPSGRLMASKADIHLTKKIKDAGKLLDIEVLDHIIITSSGYFSFADQEML